MKSYVLQQLAQDRRHHGNRESIIKYVDDATVVGLFQNTKELVMDFRRKRSTHVPLHIKDTGVHVQGVQGSM